MSGLTIGVKGITLGIEDGNNLQLPHNRLKTSQFPAEKRTLGGPGFAWTPTTVDAVDNEDAARIISACAALLYRYSNQKNIPMSVAIVTTDGPVSVIGLKPSVAGCRTLSALQADIATDLSRTECGVDGGAPVFISILNGDFEDQRSMCAERAEAESAEIHLEFSIDFDSIETAVHYDATLFEESTIRLFQKHLGRTLTAALEAPSTPVASIELYSEEEIKWFDRHCKGEEKRYDFYPIHAEFEDQAANRPDKEAIRFKGEALSYAELNQRANQVARFLRSRGVCHEDRVLLCMDPSLDFAVSLLGIFKAGASYVPLNPAYPEFRIGAIIDSTNPKIILTQVDLAHLVDRYGVESFLVDGDSRALADQDTDNLSLDIRPHQNAYIFYTSGTTGQPKGVMASHNNLMHMIKTSRERYGVTTDDVMPAIASFSFSISMYELLSPLSVGGTLVLLDRKQVLDAEYMAALLQRVTIFHAGPALLKNIVKYIKLNISDYSVFKNVRHASSGGDMVPPELLQDMQEIFEFAEVFVIYGCSEVSLMGCTWQVPGGALTRTFVGRPFTNVHLLVLDDDENQVPIDVIGNICFGGDGVVPGYLNHPKLMKELFIERDGIRYYRTGDRGRLDKDGDLEILGRRDFQVKIHGMRVELGEIEYHLRQAHGVMDGVVAGQRKPSGENALVAYYVAEPGEQVSTDALRVHMVKYLPAYMVPAFFVQLDSLPLNHNMKVDRKNLPDVVHSEMSGSVPAVSDEEKALARIWCELLGLETVGIDANFMSLGGDSLLAMQMIFIVEQRFGTKLDGMDVLRESLFVLAQMLGQRSGTNPGKAVHNKVSLMNPVSPIEAFYFGDKDSLYGMYHPAAIEVNATPVLICPPIGYEYARCHFLLRVLSENLSRLGIASLRFDFFGSGDSLGKDIDVSVNRWRSDLLCAYKELVSKTGSRKVRVFSARLTSILAFQSLQETDVDRWVLWDPIVDGYTYYQGLSRMTREKVLKLLVVRNFNFPKNGNDSEELVGSRYSSATVEEIKSLVLRREDLPRNAEVCQVLSRNFSGSQEAEQLWGNILGEIPARTVEAECDWYSSTRITTSIIFQSVLKNLEESLRD
ncbi:MAG: amino acid adenylation domain-containing protein [Gammaproteobacteria bacterium]|nr:amino acid adenylation domain-containing protein [Gammaproteobacteria bacterium]